MHQRGRAEIEHDAVGLDHARVFGRIDDTQTATDHLNQRRFVGTRAQQDDAGGRGVVVALGEHGDIDDHGQVAGLKVSERGLAVGRDISPCTTAPIHPSARNALQTAWACATVAPKGNGLAPRHAPSSDGRQRH
jgi:hypothetical protein